MSSYIKFSFSYDENFLRSTLSNFQIRNTVLSLTYGHHGAHCIPKTYFLNGNLYLLNSHFNPQLPPHVGNHQPALCIYELEVLLLFWLFLLLLF